MQIFSSLEPEDKSYATLLGLAGFPWQRPSGHTAHYAEVSRTQSPLKDPTTTPLP